MKPHSFLKNLLPAERFQLRLQATAKPGVIRELLDLLEAQRLLRDRGAAEQAVLEREAAMSTGMQDGVAIPHGKTDTVDNLVAAVGLKPEGLDFQSLDRQPARIFVLVVSPARNTPQHLRFMAEISKLLRRPSTRAALLAATAPAAALAALFDLAE
ncbi:MAG: PTS sugar transporter subunit IIA [Lentisphaeria bacterium]|jgi:PTS system nitrogen regulatory IIA component